MRSLEQVLKDGIRDIQDYPQEGVLFKDITPLLADHEGFSIVVQALAAAGRDADGKVVVDKVVGIEARGFILAAPVALALGAGFVPVRKKGKLPAATYEESYALEYGEATIEVHQDAFARGRPGAGDRRRARHRRDGRGLPTPRTPVRRRGGRYDGTARTVLPARA